MKQALILTLSVLAAGTVLAQAPPGTLTRPPAEVNPAASGGPAAAKAEKKGDHAKGTTMGASGGAMGAKAMDANSDGMISKQEYDRYHSAMWTRMKPSKGMVSTADMDAMMKGGPN